MYGRGWWGWLCGGDSGGDSGGDGMAMTIVMVVTMVVGCTDKPNSPGRKPARIFSIC
jgi:hypothetical protein